METMHTILGVCCIAADIAVPIMIAVAMYLVSRDRSLRKEDPLHPNSKLPPVLILGAVFLAIALNLLYFIMAVKKYNASEDRMTELPRFTVTSESLHDGVWDDVISHTDKGQNRSPQLSWETVAGASAYGILMLDETAQNWMHWKAASVTETTLPEGWAYGSDYIGPYPPAGDPHTYTIYVVALKVPKDGMTGSFNAPNDDPEHSLKRMLSSLDVDSNGRTGNAIALGSLSGTFTAE